MRKFQHFILFSLLSVGIFQTSAQVGIGTASPNSSAKLEVNSTTQGFLPPRMTAVQRQAIASPAAGLMIWCSDCGTDGEMQVFNGSAWTNLTGGAASAGFTCGTSTVTFNAGGGNVTYGTIVRDYGGGNVKCWLDRNLGAASTAADKLDYANYGYYYQWGRSGSDLHQIGTWNSATTNGFSNLTLTSTTSTRSDVPADNLFIINTTSPSDWRVNSTNNLWQGVNGTNNPCPSGWRLPTISEWTTEAAKWTSTNDVDDAYAYLKMTLSAGRSYANGGINNPNSMGVYWSSTAGTNVNTSKALYFGTTGAAMALDNQQRAFGFSVRCIKD